MSFVCRMAGLSRTDEELKHPQRAQSRAVTPFVLKGAKWDGSVSDQDASRAPLFGGFVGHFEDPEEDLEPTGEIILLGPPTSYCKPMLGRRTSGIPCLNCCYSNPTRWDEQKIMGDEWFKCLAQYIKDNISVRLNHQRIRSPLPPTLPWKSRHKYLYVVCWFQLSTLAFSATIWH